MRAADKYRGIINIVIWFRLLYHKPKEKGSGGLGGGVGWGGERGH